MRAASQFDETYWPVGTAFIGIAPAPCSRSYVREAAFDYLDEFVGLRRAIGAGADTDEAARREAELWGELRGFQSNLEDLESRFYVHRKLKQPAFDRLSGELDAQIRRVRAELARVQTRAVTTDLPLSSDVARVWWEQRALLSRRRLLEMLVERIVIGPGIRASTSSTTAGCGSPGGGRTDGSSLKHLGVTSSGAPA